MNKIRIYFILLALTAVACNKDELITTDVEQVPIITFDTDPAVYPVKVGREFTITPSYQFVDRAVYSWKLEETGKIISTEPQLTYRFDSGNEISEGVNGYYIDLEVTTPNGTTVETVLVEVQELLPPLISFPMQTDGLEVVKGRKYEFAPTVQSAENSTFLWTLRRPGAAEAEPVGDEAVYEFCEEIAGTYEVSLRTENEDGSDEMTIEVEVVDALAVSVTAVPIGRKYDGLTRTVSLDRTITLRPFIWNGTNPKFSWTIDGQEVGTELSYTYTPTETGIKKIVFTVTDTTDEPEMTLSKCITRTNETRATLEFTVECHSEEESHRRPASGASSATWDRVYEYTPAPGQFINELVSGGFTGTETSPEAAVAYAEERMKKNTWVSLGGWGGYIVVGFDHSIDNSSSGYKGGYNFSITGNAFKGSSEPGIVYVMQDTNGNTLPDDEWYELKGSEYGKEETVQDYAVTYYRPTYSGADVQWKDNQGVKGKIDYLKQYHDQPSPEAAVAYAEERMKKNTWVSLGGWGGYIVVGFDHSIDNSSSGYKGGYNFSITGNAFKGSSEPGIVYVMQDTNGNTLPDDEWYELKGSEYGKEETVQDYAVTYYRPTYSGADVQWKDNQGVKGKIDYLKQYHDQPSYYPAWIGTDSYTLYGPCLKSRTYDQSGNGSYWVNGEYDWGYADNFGNDRLSEDDNAAAGAMKVYFKISNAVDKNGQPANLKYIDFIRVQTGVNAKAGWLGENSTEVFGFTDENINQGK